MNNGKASKEVTTRGSFADWGPSGKKATNEFVTVDALYVLKEAGYRTGLVGKWHIQPKPTAVGFDFAVYPRVAHRYTGQTYIDANDNETVIEDFAPSRETPALEQFIGENRDEPFFLYHIQHRHADSHPEQHRSQTCGAGTLVHRFRV